QPREQYVEHHDARQDILRVRVAVHLAQGRTESEAENDQPEDGTGEGAEHLGTVADEAEQFPLPDDAGNAQAVGRPGSHRYSFGARRKLTESSGSLTRLRSLPVRPKNTSSRLPASVPSTSSRSCRGVPSSTRRPWSMMPMWSHTSASGR